MKRYLFIVMVLVLLIVPATGCRQTSKATTVPSDLTITLERTSCKGECPVYKLSVSGNGTATYEGLSNVKVAGYLKTSVSEEKMGQLVSEVKKIDYFSLSDNYTEHVIPDAPWVFTSVTIDGKTKIITHYSGDTNAPAKLVEFEDRIDEILNTDQLVK